MSKKQICIFLSLLGLPMFVGIAFKSFDDYQFRKENLSKEENIITDDSQDDFLASSSIEDCITSICCSKMPKDKIKEPT